MNYNDKTREDLIKEIEELQDANFHNLAESIQDGIVIANPAGQHLYVNRRAAKILQYSCEELLLINMKELAHSSAYPIMHQRLLDQIAGRPVPSTYEVLIRRKDGNCFQAEVTGTKTLWRGQECDLVVFRDISMRKKVETELQQSKRELTILMDNLPGMVYSCLNDKNWTMTFVSEGSSDLTGYLPYELMDSKLSFNDIIHPDVQGMVWDTIQQALEKRSTYTLEYRIITKSGQIKHVWERGQGVFDEKSELRHLEGFVTDISQRKLAEFENIRTHKLLEDSQRIGKVGGWEFDFDTQELKWTKEMYRIHEVDLTFKPTVDKRVNFYTPESLAAVDEAVKYAMERGESYEVDSEIITAKGNRRIIKAIGKADLDNRRIFGLIQDITEQRRVEEALKVSEEKYRNLFEKSQVAMFRSTMDGSKIHDFNAKLLETLGFTRAEMISNPSTIRYSNPEERNELIKILQKSGSVSNFEVNILKKDRMALTVLMSVIHYPDEGILEGSFVDITDRKLAEAELKNKNEQLKELNATKDKFFSIIAHDLKSPFNGILGFSEILKNEARDLDIDSIVDFTEMIHTAANQAYKLLENLLEWARIQQGHFHFEPKNNLINNMINNDLEGLKYNARQKNISLVNGTNDNIIITADEKMLSTVLRNLISNAIKFTPKNGFVNVEAIIKVNHLEVSVSDTGVGMDHNTIEKLFKIESGFTSRGTENETGSGLGLLLCKEFVEKHGGKIWAESELGKGSKFSFSIPFKD